MLTDDERRQWDVNGFFVRRGFVDPAVGWTLADAAIAEIRADPIASHPGQPAWKTPGGLLIQPESQPVAGAVQPEDHIAKLFNMHLAGPGRDFAVSPACGALVADILGSDVDVFQSMFILKNPGAWGQPWHQDSHYFNFDSQPQVGLWLAISAATPKNGCLLVLPGSHKQPVQPHGPDRRPGANYGYLEIGGVDERGAVTVEMQPGDLLVFHSHLLHKSVDNRCDQRRAAMVYHYGRAGTRNLAAPAQAALQANVLHWVPAWRRPVDA